jgi:hypothetical protein
VDIDFSFEVGLVGIETSSAEWDGRRRMLGLHACDGAGDHFFWFALALDVGEDVVDVVGYDISFLRKGVTPVLLIVG